MGTPAATCPVCIKEPELSSLHMCPLLPFCPPSVDNHVGEGRSRAEGGSRKGRGRRARRQAAARRAVRRVPTPQAALTHPSVPPQHHASLVMSQDPYKVTTFEKRYAVAMQWLWRDAGIRACYERRREFHLLDSAV